MSLLVIVYKVEPKNKKMSSFLKKQFFMVSVQGRFRDVLGPGQNEQYSSSFFLFAIINCILIHLPIALNQQMANTIKSLSKKKQIIS